MNRFVFTKSLTKNYIDFKNKIRKNRKLINQLKLATTIWILVFTIWLYAYFVNISSTKWYFLREETNKLEEEKFLHSLAQLDVLKEKRNVWKDIQEDSSYKQNNVGRQPQWLSVNDRVIHIQTNTQLVRN